MTTQTVLLGFIASGRSEATSAALGVTGLLFLILKPFIEIPGALYRLLNINVATRSARRKILAELHLYESGQICNSYSHVEIAKLRKQLAELG